MPYRSSTFSWPRNRRKHGRLDGGPTLVAKFNPGLISVLPLASLIFRPDTFFLITAADRRTKRGAETAGLRGVAVALAAEAVWLSFLGHLRLPVTSFTSVNHGSLEGEAATAWQGGGGPGGVTAGNVGGCFSCDIWCFTAKTMFHCFFHKLRHFRYSPFPSTQLQKMIRFSLLHSQEAQQLLQEFEVGCLKENRKLNYIP